MLIEQVVTIVAAKFVQRFGHLALGRGGEVTPALALFHRQLGRDRAVGVDGIAAVQEEIRIALAHRAVDTHAADVRVDAEALADGVAAPDKAHIAARLRCTAQVAVDGRAQHAAVGIFEAHAIEDVLIARQTAQVRACGEVVRRRRGRAVHAPRLTQAWTRVPFHPQPRRAIGTAPQHRAVVQHIAALHTVGDDWSPRRRGQAARGPTGSGRQQETGAQALQDPAAGGIGGGHACPSGGCGSVQV